MYKKIRVFNMSPGIAVTFSVLSLLIQATPVLAVDPTPSGYVLPETETWELEAEGSEPYQIFVSRPKGPPPTEGYPVLYVLDGNSIFASFAEARRIQAGEDSNPFARPNIGNTLIVAVGYQTDWPFDVRRLYDLTPPMLEKAPAKQAQLSEYSQGGHDRFLDILVNKLRPEVARRYSINPDRQALFGHSLGGLFALHVLYTQPDAFNAIIAASPAQWWNDQEILTEEREFTHRLSQSANQIPVSRILIIVGGQEENTETLWDAEALARRLEPLSAFGLRSRFERLDNEAHVTVPSQAVTSALRFAFNTP